MNKFKQCLNKADDIVDYIRVYCYLNDLNAPSALSLGSYLYYIQAQFLVEFNRPAFEEDLVAIDWGVYIPRLFRKYLVYGSYSIPFTRFDAEKEEEFTNAIVMSKKERKYLEEIIRKCSEYSASALSSFIKAQEPWKNNYTRGYRTVIPLEDLKEFFQKFIS